MKVIFFGLGSIGKRHLKNLFSYGKEHSIDFEVTAFSTSGNRKFSGVTYIQKKEEIGIHYDLAFITNPTFKHLETLELIKDKADFVFLEKPVFSESIELDEKENYGQNIYVAAPLRYKKIMDAVRRKIPSQNVYSVRVICSTYLPNWRKDTNYKENYSAFREMGGGVELDCIHELDYIIHLFGFPKTVDKQFGKFSRLEIKSNDLATYLLRYEDKVIELHLDYFGKKPQRKFELFTEDGLIEVDLLENKLSVNSVLITKEFEDSNEMYCKELEYFMEEVITSKSNWNNLCHANEVLKIAEEK
mgnify:CR=1 FL=1